jgi:16S rRNA (guanine966-N2)-methyltransferase
MNLVFLLSIARLSRFAYTLPMRVISGLYGGRTLKSPPDNKTRPTSDRLRETLFNILAPYIGDDTRFLDLCAGTGAIGIEALSRGAAFVTFVDRSKKACAVIEENLDKLGVPEVQTDILGLEAENFTGREHKEGWDIAFFDPPYDSDYSLVLHEFGYRRPLLNDGGILIVEHHAKKGIPDEVGDLRRWRILKQGDTWLSFFERE